MRRPLFVALALLCAALAFSAAVRAAEVRTWTDIYGVSVEAEFLRFDGAYVFLKKTDGRPVRIDLPTLSEADRAYVRAQAASPATPPPAPLPPTRPAANAKVMLEGTFEWSGQRGQTHELEGTLTPDGPGKWTAVWKFKWGGRPMTYTGTVAGDLQNGKVSGTGVEASGRRNFTFEGRARDGAWTFDHFEIIRGKPTATGPGTARVKL